MEEAALAVGVAGLVVVVLGLTFAGYQILKTGSAAERAEIAANTARTSLAQVISITDLNQASAQIDQLKELHQHREFVRAVDRYTPRRQLLIRASARFLEKAEIFESANQQLRIMEQEVRGALAEESPMSGSRFDGILLDMQQALDEAVSEIEQLVASNLEDKR